MADDNYFLIRGDCRDALAAFDDDSLDAVVTDPPYGLSKEPKIEDVLTHWLAGDDYEHGGSGFMGKAWDSFVPGPSVWREVRRVLKPGGHALVFAGTRTADLMGIALRMAGFEVRDMLSWMYGQGFPKSQNVSKAADKQGMDGSAWDGWGTALKPAFEPILLVRKPLRVDGKKATIVSNVLAHGTGALNIDGSRISAGGDKLGGGAESKTSSDQKGNEGWTRPWMDDPEAQEAHAARVRDNVVKAEALGRFPANVLLGHHDDCEQVGTHTEIVGGGAKMSKTGGATVEFGGGYDRGDGFVGSEISTPVWDCHEDCPVRLLDSQSGDLGVGRGGLPSGSTGAIGGASRFFYQAKASKAERKEGLPEGSVNDHPTVKPVELMRYLVRLITPPGGTVLDPYVGSGTTGVAAVSDGFAFVGIDLDENDHYLRDIATHRIDHAGGHGFLASMHAPTEIEDLADEA